MSDFIEDTRSFRPVELPADIRESSDLAEHIMKRIFHPSRRLDRQEAWALFINSDEFISHELRLTQWERDLTRQDIGDIFHMAIEHDAWQILLASNHLSGDPTPTPSEMQLTQRLKAAGEVLFIPVLDHIIVTQSSWHSMLEQSWDFSST